MSQRGRPAPSNWDAYERGRASSFGSLNSVPEEGQTAGLSSSATPTQRIPQNDGQDGQDLRRRRSSIAVRINSIRQMGGPNSIDNFAKSFQRAANFREITPIRRNSISVDDDRDGDEEQPSEGRTSQGPSPQQKSLLRQQFEAAGGHGADSSAIQDMVPEQSETPASERTALLHSPRDSNKLFAPASYQGSVRSSMLGQSVASISKRLTPAAQRRASILIEQQREASLRALEADEDEYKYEVGQQTVEEEVRPDGEIIERTVGESTVPMTIFNSTNVLIGVGILALPLAVKHSGWIIGLTFLTLAALVTSYTARLLAHCLDTNSGSTTYGDIAFLAFGGFGRNLVESLFILELTAANVALMILFADSMNSLIPSISTLGWKFIVSIGLIPVNFVPFKTLSLTSILGIVCTLGILLIVLIDGFLKPTSPGSLLEIAKTYAFPQNWRTIPLSLGLFPAIYKDMRHPQKYSKSVSYTYIFTYILDLSMAVIGYLMFGDSVRDEVTSNILKSTFYPPALSVLIVVLIAIIPITKIPLSNRPMIDTINKKFLIDLRQMDPKARKRSEKSWKHRSGRTVIACSANLIELGISIIFPDFDSVMALMGSALCFTICVIMPVGFYLKIFSLEGKEIGKWERVMDYMLIVVCCILAVLGTVFAILPKDKIGIQ
jgi:solute carrier family 32 (vesicular inhibitory amino acid transporter)